MTDGNRPVRSRMPGGVGGVGSNPAPTRLSDFIRNESKVSKLSRCALPRKPDTRGDAEY